MNKMPSIRALPEITKELLPPIDGYGKYGFGRMEIGDSMEVFLGENPRAEAAAYSYAKRHKDFKFKTKRTPNNCLRIWRIPSEQPKDYPERK